MNSNQRWCLVGALLAVLAGLSNLGVSSAVSYSIVNPWFGKNARCTLTGWTTTGTVGTAVGDKGNCLARLTASKDLSVSPARESIAKVEQSYILSSSKPNITFYYSSNLAGLTLRIYDISDVLLYEEVITAQSGSALVTVKRSFPDFAGMAIKVSVQAQVISPLPGKYTEQQLLVDFGVTDGNLYIDPDPDAPPGGTF
jgi:hypothetical protein